MKQVYGHETARTRLEAELPVCTMLRGPESIGKWTLAEYLSEYHKYIAADVFKAQPLSTEQSRELKRFMSTSSFGKAGKLALLDLDGSTEQSLNALLKLLEEPPPRSKFVLVTSRRTLDTIASRSHVYGLGLLETAEVRQVLVHRMGLDPELSWRASELARGQVSGATGAERVEAAKGRVLGVLKAIAEADTELFHTITSKTGREHRWDRECHQLLRTWCIEAITGRWRVFSEAETFGLTSDKKIPRKILFSLSLDSSPALAVRVGLEPLLAERQRTL